MPRTSHSSAGSVPPSFGHGGTPQWPRTYSPRSCRLTTDLGEVLAKIADWLAAGTKIVWVVDPERQEVRVYRPDGSLSVLGSSDSLDGEDILPGFTCALTQVFA